MSDARRQSRLMVLMFTDIVGSVDLKQRAGDSVAANLIARHDQLFRYSVGAFAYAEILKDLGDGFLARFASASDAVHAALHFQNALERTDWKGHKLKVRIGLHLGEVSELDMDDATGKPKISGLAVDIAARVMGLSLPGQILMTRAAFDNARQYVREHQSSDGETPAVTRRWIAHGRYLFKGAEEPLEVFEVGEVGVAPFLVPPDSEKAKRAVAADQEETLGWRPAVGMEVPDRKHWILDRKLGEGGFGEVWLGENTRTHNRRVFKFCFDSDRLRSFKRELMLFRILQQSLGDRNDIAKLHEVQVEEPPFYLESEFTEDGSLVDWAAEQGGIGKVPLATRLDIVARTAIAVSAAHSVGILHKDIKPSNILIYRTPDGTPLPRLTDFGIGELTDPSKLEGRNFTMTAMGDSLIDGNDSSRTGTRIYAPPEVLMGKRFTIQGDVYALGVLLYQMVVGDLERPLAQGWERDVPDPLLRTDITRCVEGNESERLSSAKELADRLQSLGARRKARARRRFARLGGIASIVLVGLLSLSAVWLVRETGLRVKAEREALKASQVSAFLQNMLTAVDQRMSPTEGRNVKVVDKLDQAVKRLDEGELADQPEVAAYVRAALGNAYKAGSQYSEAEVLLQTALDIRRKLSSEPSLELGQNLEDLGAAKWNNAHYEEADKLFVESLEARRAVSRGANTFEVASSLNYLGASRDRMGKHDEAEQFYRQALDIRRNLAKTDKEQDLVARSINNLGTCLREKGEIAEAEKLFTEAVDIERRLHGPNYIDVANGLSNIASCMAKRGDYDGAEKRFLESLESKRVVYGESHASYAITLAGLADVQVQKRNLPEAEKYARQAVEVRRKALRPGHPAFSSSLAMLAEILASQQRHADAVPVLQEEVENRKKDAPDDDPDIADAKSRLGACLGTLGRNEEAQPLLTAAYESLKNSPTAKEPLKQAAARRLVSFLDATGQSALADPIRASASPSSATRPTP